MKTLRQRTITYSQKIIDFGVLAILALMPFHAFFSVYLGYVGFNRNLVQSWKEILIIILVFSWFIYQMANKRLAFKLDSINIIFFSIVLLSLLITLINHPNSEAILFGIKTNLVAIGLYFIAQTPTDKKSFIKNKILWFILAPAIVVSILAILQTFIISPDFLYRLGYGKDTIDPKQIVDGSLSIFRSFSTLGGPNQLGAYLLVPLAFAVVYGIKQKKWIILSFALPILVAIGLSFSRSAWIGAILTLSISIIVAVNKKQRVLISIASLIVVLTVAVAVGILAVKNQRFQNVVLHGRYFENRIEGSDQGRIQAVRDVTNSIIAYPFGHGLGSAGPASFRSEKPVIPENWYLQIAYEIGVIGLILYILVFAGLIREFIKDINSPLAASLLAATIGILVVNLFLQAWADSTLVLIMFALYGAYRSQNQ